MAVANYVARWLVPFLLCVSVWVFGMGRSEGEIYLGLIFWLILFIDLVSHRQVFQRLEDAAYNEEKEYVFLFWRSILNCGAGMAGLLVISLRIAAMQP